MFSVSRPQSSYPKDFVAEIFVWKLENLQRNSKRHPKKMSEQKKNQRRNDEKREEKRKQTCKQTCIKSDKHFRNTQPDRIKFLR